MNVENVVHIIKRKTDLLMSRLDPEEFVQSKPLTENGTYSNRQETFLQPGWTHSFFLANVAYMYLCFKEDKYLDYLKKNSKKYLDFLFHNEAEIGHDTGFLYSLYAVAMYKITGEDLYRQLALKAADEVAKRIRFKPGHIQAFFDLRVRGINDDVSLMIVDDMMNMCLLMWAYGQTGHSFYRDVYESHIATAVRHLIRSDYSVCHAYHFDVHTGNPVCEMNYCGFAVGSHWARGTSWVIYGLLKAFEFTDSKEKYLQPLIGVLGKWFECLNGKLIPIWDFRLPDDASKKCVDTSAAAIVASAFAGIDNNSSSYYIHKAKEYSHNVLDELCNGKWLCDDNNENILDYGDGTGCLWGDYFFTELVMKEYLKDEFIDFWI